MKRLKRILFVVGFLLLSLAYGYAAKLSVDVWNGHNTISPDERTYAEFRVRYHYDPSGSGDYWCKSGLNVYIDDKSIGIFEFFNNCEELSGDKKGRTITGEGYTVTLTDISHDGSWWSDEHWYAYFKVYCSNVYDNFYHTVKFTAFYDGGLDQISHTVKFDWDYLPAANTLTSIGDKQLTYSGNNSSDNCDQYISFPTNTTKKDSLALPNDNTEHGKVASAGDKKFGHTFNVGSNYVPTTYYPYQYIPTNDGVTFYHQLNTFTTVHYHKAMNVQCNYNQWNRTIALTWDTLGYDLQASKAGKWHVYRVHDDDEVEIAKDLAFSKCSYNDNIGNNIDYGKTVSYKVYFVPSSWTDQTAKPEDLLATSGNVKLDRTFTIVPSIEGREDNIMLSWRPQAIGVNTSCKYTIYRTQDNETEQEIYSFPVTNRDTSYYEYIDKKIPNTHSTYTYRVGITLLGVDFTSDKVKSTISGVSRVTSVYTSKGSYSNAVRVNWTAKQIGTDATHFVLSRRVLGTEDEWNDIYQTSGTSTAYSYNDQTLANGIFYEYKVQSYSVYSNTGEHYAINELTNNGFCSLTGTISGNITFNSGTAVAGVKVSLEKVEKEGENSLSQFFALYSSGINGGICWKPTQKKFNRYLKDKKWTLQMYLNPEDACKTPDIFSADELAVSLGDYRESDGTFAVFANGVKFDTLRIKKNQYTHLTLGYKGSSLLELTLIDKVQHIQQATATVYNYTGFTGSDTCVYVCASSSPTVSNGYVGHVDEIRFFSDRVLTLDEITTNYDHTLTGEEKGLVAYWPLDEGINNQKEAYDYSMTSSVPNENHASILHTNSKIDDIVPSSSQLSLYGLTDETGNYIIRGIHYTGAGTNYIVRPTLGIHEFSPVSLTRYISATSNVYSGSSFTDVSSFPVSGTIYYENTNYPVEECTILVDGVAATKDNELVYSDNQGNFTVDVPIGSHYVSVSKSGHTFTAEGRYPETGTKDFNDAISGLAFYDNTLVTVAGRVDGGAIEYEKPLGFGSSKCNIGQAEIKLTTSKIINAAKDTQGTASRPTYAATARTFDTGNTLVNSTASAGYGSEEAASEITILTDPETGEFCAQLPPLPYVVSSITIPSNPEAKITGYKETIDATNVMTTTTDSIQNAEGSYDKFTYTASLNVAYRTQPVFTYSQRYNADGAFGDPTFTYTDDKGKEVDYPLYTVTDNSDGSTSVDYAFKYPIFTQFDNYELEFEGYEQYINKDSKGYEYTTKVPLKDVDVTINNQFSINNYFRRADGTLLEVEENVITLDSLGKAYYVFKIGVPSLLESEEYTRTMSISYNIDGTTYSAEQLKGIILGYVPTGNSFVTAGPDEVMMVLRDPPGSNSSATWAKGSSVKTSITSTYSDSKTHNVKTTMTFGTNIWTGVGVSFGVSAMTITQAESENSAYVDVKLSSSSSSSETTTITSTASQSISTSSDPDYDGVNGDVFIGRATNLVFGQAKDVGLHVGDNGKLELGVKDIFTQGSSFGTDFAYSQQEIKGSMLGEWARRRNSLILPMGTDTVNNTAFYKYVSKVPSDDPNFGEEGTYYSIAPKSSNLAENQIAFDSIIYFNNQITNWTNVLKANEKAKVEAIQKYSSTKKNYSFDGGASITNTVTGESSSSSSSSHETSVGTDIGFDVNVKIFGNGSEITNSNDISVSWKTENSSETSSSSSFSYTLQENTNDDLLTVDVYENIDGFGPIFVTRAGATSGNWEDQAVTEYYQPGTEIMARTQRVFVPTLSVQENVKNNIPVGSSALYNLTLSNQSEVTSSWATFTLRLVSDADINGAKVLLDGSPIGLGVTGYYQTGTEAKKTLEVIQTDPDVLDYKIGLVLVDESQKSPLNFPVNGDTCWIEAHFVPSSQVVTLSTTTPSLNAHTSPCQAQFEISDYDLNQKNLVSLALQYKGEYDEKWITDQIWYTPTHAMQGVDTVTTSTLSYAFDMSNSLSFPDGTYSFRVVTTSQFSSGNVTQEGNEITVIKDLVAPKVQGNPQPYNLTYNQYGYACVSFNESVQPITADNITLTGHLNTAELTHSTSMRFTGGQGAYSESKLMMGASNTFNAWVYYEGGKGYIFQRGTTDNVYTIKITSDSKLSVVLDGKEYVSTEALPVNKWFFLSVAVDASSTVPTLNADYAVDTQTVTLLDDVTIGTQKAVMGAVAIGDGFHGRLHEVSLWDNARDFATSLASRSKEKNRYTSHLSSYWKLNEGHGSVATETVAAINLVLGAGATWDIDAKNYALQLTQDDEAKINLSTVATDDDQDYLLQFWFRAESEQPTGLHNICTINDKTKVQIKTNGTLVLSASGIETLLSNANLMDGTWHQLSIQTMKSTNANTLIYLDGNLVATVSSAYIANLMGDLTLGGNLNGYFDEVRISLGRYAEDVINDRLYERYDADMAEEAGMVAYYPFEQITLNSYGLSEVTSTEKDLLGSNPDASLFSGKTCVFTDSIAPALNEAPQYQSVKFECQTGGSGGLVNNYVGFVITQDKTDIQGCTLTATIRGVKDLAGNQAAPISWSFFVDDNTLEWKGNYTYSNGMTVLATDTTNSIIDNSKLQAVITNNSTMYQTYRIEGVPDWMEASTTSGMIAGGGNVTVTFKLLSSVPTGITTGYIYLVDSYGISHSLPYGIIYLRSTPDFSWYYNDYSKYPYTMTLTGQVVNDGVIQDSEFSILIAKTPSGEVIGKSTAVYYPRYGSSFYEMTIHGDSTTTNFSFYYYDALTATIYPKLTLQEGGTEVTFTTNDNKGSHSNPYKLSTNNMRQMNTSFNYGWDLLSVNVKTDENKLLDVLGYNVDHVIQDDKFSSYGYDNNTDSICWHGDVERIETGKAYKIKSNRTWILDLVGTPVADLREPITIQNGWNWLGANVQNSTAITTALADLHPEEYDFIKDFNNFSEYTGGAWIGQINSINPGKGYFYHSNAASDKTFAYPSSATITSQARATFASGDSNTEQQHYYGEPNYSKYTGTMPIVAVVKRGNEVVDNCEVIALDENGEVRGAKFCNKDGHVYLVVHGDESQTINLEVVVDENGKKVKYDVPVTVSFQDLNTDYNYAKPLYLSIDEQGPVGIEAVEDDERPRGIRYEDGNVVIYHPDGKYDAKGVTVPEK